MLELKIKTQGIVIDSLLQGLGVLGGLGFLLSYVCRWWLMFLYEKDYYIEKSEIIVWVGVTLLYFNYLIV